MQTLPIQISDTNWVLSKAGRTLCHSAAIYHGVPATFRENSTTFRHSWSQNVAETTILAAEHSQPPEHGMAEKSWSGSAFYAGKGRRGPCVTCEAQATTNLSKAWKTKEIQSSYFRKQRGAERLNEDCRQTPNHFSHSTTTPVLNAGWQVTEAMTCKYTAAMLSFLGFFVT